MLEQARDRTAALQSRMRDAGIDVALFSDEDSIAWLGGCWGYLGMEFGRPTLLVVPVDDAPTLLTPLMEGEMMTRMSWIEDVRTWEDTGPRHWSAQLESLLGSPSGRLAVEERVIPQGVRQAVESIHGKKLADVSPLLVQMRMIKDDPEIAIMREAGAVAGAMMAAAEASLAPGVPEYESAIAIIAAGSRKAAEFLAPTGWDTLVSPMIHNLQIMQSGEHTAMVHRRASVRRYQVGDPVYFCLCNTAQYKHYRLGFDRMFYVGEASPRAVALQETAIAAQAAALATLRDGVVAEEVAEAANTVYQERGFSPGYRTGRAIGMSYLESPELKQGDRTVLRAGMTFAVDGGVTVEGEGGGRIGDSVVVTRDGFEFLTEYPRRPLVVAA